MTEAVSSPQSSDGWRTTQILYIDAVHHLLKIQYKDEQKPVSLNYQGTEIEDAGWEKTDWCEIKEINGNFHGIRPMPGCEPPTPKKVKEELLKQSEEKQKEEKKSEKKKLAHVVMKGSGYIIIFDPLEEKEIKLDVSQDKNKFLTYFNQGQIVGYEREFNSEKKSWTLKSIWKLNEDGTRPEKKQNGGWGGSRYDPEVEKLRLEQDFKRTLLLVHKDLLIACQTQYPVDADPDNMERGNAYFLNQVDFLLSTFEKSYERITGRKE